MKKVVYLSLALATMSLAQEIPPGVDTPTRAADSREISSPRNQAGQVQAEEEEEEEERPPRIMFEIGVQTTSVDGKKNFGFQAYRDLPQGAFVRRFDYQVKPESSPLQFSFRSQDLMQRDMAFGASMENIGRFRIDLDFWSFSRYWSDRDRSVLIQGQPGFLVVSDAMRSSLEATMAGLKPGTNCSAWSGCAVATANVANAGESEIRSYRQRGTLTQMYELREGLTLRLNFMRERRSGNRFMSEGAYSRQDTPIGVVFEMPGQELWEPTDYRTTEFGAELGYKHKNWLANIEYTGSLFHNDIGSLIWQNPFRITPAQAVLNGDPYKDGAQGRFQFAETQSSLPPNSQAHSFTGSLLLFLPHSSKISALVSWSRWTQNDAFLPFTINPAITVNNALTPTNPPMVKKLMRPAGGNT